MGDYVPEGKKQQLRRMHEEADRHIAETRRMADETDKMLEESRRKLINSFMKGLIEFIETKEGLKHK